MFFVMQQNLYGNIITVCLILWKSLCYYPKPIQVRLIIVESAEQSISNLFLCDSACNSEGIDYLISDMPLDIFVFWFTVKSQVKMGSNDKHTVHTIIWKYIIFMEKSMLHDSRTSTCIENSGKIRLSDALIPQWKTFNLVM